MLNAKIGDASTMGVRLRLDGRIPSVPIFPAMMKRPASAYWLCPVPAFVKGKFEAGQEFGIGSGCRQTPASLPFLR